MKRLGILWFCGLVFLPPGAGARLGETENQIADRYGHVCQVSPAIMAGIETACVWQVSIYEVYVGFSNHVSVLECVHKKAEDGSLLDEDEVAKFKAANAPGMTWKSYGPGIDQLAYQRSDKKAWCIWYQSDRKVSFCTDAVKQAIDAAAAREKEKQLAPF